MSSSTMSSCPDEWAGEAVPFQLPIPDTPFYCLPNGLRFPFPKVGVAGGHRPLRPRRLR